MLLVQRRREFLPILLAAGLFFGGAQQADAGCGCDHPPPPFQLVEPAFGSPGKTIHIYANGVPFTTGATYEVEFGSADDVMLVAGNPDHLEVVVPDDVRAGPVEIQVKGDQDDFDLVYGSEYFTALSPAPVVPSGDGVWMIPNFQASVAEDGTLLIPFNLSQIQDGTQFMFQMGGVRLGFGQDDVVFYNKDGFDLTLFTLEVTDPTQRQWGSYYGWSVEQDTGISGDVYENKVRGSLSRRFLSDTLTYWRHEFHTYRQAHLPGGTHEVGADGMHQNLGTFHVDHDHLVVALYGKERSFWYPDDPTKEKTLKAGSRTTQLFVATRMSDNPIEPEVMEADIWDGFLSGGSLPMVLELPTAYDGEDD